MHTYEITTVNSCKLQVKATDICAALYEYTRNESDKIAKVAKVECIDKALIRHHVSEVNSRLHDYGRDYHDAHEIMPYIREILLTNGFDVTALDTTEVNGQEGERRCVDIGRGVYFCLTWYRLQTGRYEVVAYVS